ncbi:MAG: acyltransferase [Levilactobacillus sp.]|jgi:acetyltransferase-like isoleucine patch superfamily enzyme|uniref:acyltransferase n=1 Tax=Levilactobacillus sp. TaxID=2767919 RepID=UPI002585873D|nr:acyltransferase [Levilactobacillus sp.]MCH4123827.1 acyltransferase [Levilactobacillus sp.]MCI1553925.1 acyltransferase [Levilactobacillus sp.]
MNLFLERIIRQVTGKKGFELSQDIPLTYIMRKGTDYIFGLVRGKLRGSMLRHGRKLFVGRGVKLRVRSKMHFGDNVRLENHVEIDALSVNGVYLDDRVKLGSNSVIQCTGSLREVGQGIKIGRDTSFAENTFFGAAGGINIGDDVISGQNVRFHAENHNFSDSKLLIREQGVTQKGITIGNNVWIGAGAVFLDGCCVGNGSVVAANSVVTGIFHDGVVVGGVPAKVIKTIGDNRQDESNR